MARANRHHIPGQVWHITHRCHKKEFLLKFARDRKRWLQWLFEAKKRYGLVILNYTATSNHIHLLVVDGDRCRVNDGGLLRLIGKWLNAGVLDAEQITYSETTASEWGWIDGSRS